VSLSRILRAAVVLGMLATTTTACALFAPQARWAHVRAVRPTSDSPTAMDDADYAGAVSAIHRRDYAGALDFLQAARLRKGDDVRVLNAFGVVYDKLGRFDLSERYYRQARAIDPTSAIVAGNLAYSLELQGRSARSLVRSYPDARSAVGGD
jgi:Flp pilus assembly protein TadD